MLSPDVGHGILLGSRPLLAFDENKPFESQRDALKLKLREVLGDEPERVEPRPVVTTDDETDEFIRYGITFDAEPGVRCECALLVPKTGAPRYPLCVCLQGHSTGMHISWGGAVYPGDSSDGDRDIALHAVRRGFAALCVEQRGFGTRRSVKYGPISPEDGKPKCRATAFDALMLGRTLIGERCFDISRAIDVALGFDFIDPDGIVCTGNSGGGTATYYASCLDERIKVSMPSCAVCTYRDSILAMWHCECNYLPGAAKYFDMGDLAALIAPRALVIINGRYDSIFPAHGVEKSYETVKKIYAAAGAPDRCALMTGEGEHRYYASLAWEGYDKVTAG